MKKNRQEAIIELIQQYPIETQEELLSRLNQIGFKTTQATISRDIRELALIKKPDAAADAIAIPDTVFTTSIFSASSMEMIASANIL